MLLILLNTVLLLIYVLLTLCHCHSLGLWGALHPFPPHPGALHISLGAVLFVCCVFTQVYLSVPLTGLERMLSSSLNMDLSLPTSESFTCLTAITAAVVELARHFAMPRSVFTQCLGI
ncbi:hypothetical protein AVEN_8961-1 [Araneus ventricosus]|uniref:Uncharacterized protein n=1 Tax=Araneus ventricosus TaxID=182803 RepID=A0A4Y2RMX2_ARAVE|nr:hypothetical protein AVEN_8961-1 [Araneus ventricosus]